MHLSKKNPIWLIGNMICIGETEKKEIYCEGMGRQEERRERGENNGKKKERDK